MSKLLRANRILRAATLVLIAAGVAVHLWLATRTGLVLIAIGVVAHLAAALFGRIWWKRRQRDQDAASVNGISRGRGDR